MIPLAALLFSSATAAQEPVSTVRQIMEAMIVPASDTLFAAGSREPSSDADWRAIESASILLAESGNLLLVEGRARETDAWKSSSRILVDAGKRALEAAASRNVEGLLEAGDRLMSSCETCHESHLDPSRSTEVRKPDLNGIWQAIGTAHWDLEAHEARQGPLPALGALGAVPAGIGVVEGGTIPYRPDAEAQRKENQESWLSRDPAVKCFLPGVPRATYMPFPFQIVQSKDVVLIAYEFASAARIIYMDRPDFESPIDTWMGHSIGRWEGETLVVDVTSQVPDTWLDSSGNFHSEALRVQERYTPSGRDVLMYEATIEDPNLFTRPWTIRLPLYRRLEKNAQLLEFKCVEFAEEMMYGHLRRKRTEESKK